MATTPVPPAARHGANALAALIILALAGFAGIRSLSQQHATPLSATLAIEHAKPASVQITLGRRADRTMIDISVRAQEAVILSVPEGWHLRETRGVALSSVTQTRAADGYRSLRMPTGTASFIAAQAIDSVSIHNPTGQPLRAQVLDVDLTTGTHHDDEAIIMEHPVTLPHEIPVTSQE